MTTTTIFLDVDGVINAVTHGYPTKDTGWPEFLDVQVHGYRITYAPELIDRINALAERDDVEIRWLTTWCDLAPAELAPAVGLKGQDWVVVGKDQLELDPTTQAYWSATGWWKLNAIQADWNPAKGRAVWADDDITLYRHAHEWSFGRDDVLAIVPQGHLGLTRKHIEQIEAFCS